MDIQAVLKCTLISVIKDLFSVTFNVWACACSIAWVNKVLYAVIIVTTSTDIIANIANIDILFIFFLLNLLNIIL